jgi:hypothetical protein
MMHSRNIALLTLAALLGCNAVLGIEELPAGMTYAVEGCGSCIQTSCSGEEAACYDDAACWSLHTCYAGCQLDDVSCRDQCERAAPDGVTESSTVTNLDTCRRGSCLDACLGDGGLVPSVFDEETCAKCIDDKCGDDGRACVASRRCERAYGCGLHEACDDPACALRCLYDEGETLGITEAGSVSSCWRDNCRAECRLGELWQCVGEFNWKGPEDTLKSALFELEVLDHAGEPATGLLVEACFAGECELIEPSSDKVDAEGFVQLELPLDASGWIGHFRISGTLPMWGPAFPTLFRTGRPISRHEDRFRARVFPDSVLDLVTKDFPTLDSSKGHISAILLDCLGFKAGGGQLSLEGDPGAVGFYFAGEGLVPATADSRTDGTGAAGFLNVTPGDHTIVMTIPDRLGSKVVSSQKLSVEAGTLTNVFLQPNE